VTLLQIVSAFVAALGAALFLGTGAALFTYRRTGAFPGQPAADEQGRPIVPSVRTAVTKVALGALLLVLGLASYGLLA
jgi:hypothetical protein